MQTKYFKVISKEYKVPLEDDLGNVFYMFKIEYTEKSVYPKTKEWVVMTAEKEECRREEMFFKVNNNLEKYTHRHLEVNGKEIILQYRGATGMFSPYPCLDKKDLTCGIRIKPIVI